MEAYEVYQTPLSARYASKEMAHLFSSAVRTIYCKIYYK
jgi:adenylosuccinate lyase